jgi:hypothetical protein
LRHAPFLQQIHVALRNRHREPGDVFDLAEYAVYLHGAGRRLRRTALPNGPHGAAAIAVRSADGGLIFPLTSFSISIGPGTCHINHQQSNTGNIIVNSDADGDIITCGSSYECAPPPKDAVKIP